VMPFWNCDRFRPLLREGTGDMGSKGELLVAFIR
jgi:hypothetical protein